MNTHPLLAENESKRLELPLKALPRKGVFVPKTLPHKGIFVRKSVFSGERAVSKSRKLWYSWGMDFAIDFNPDAFNMA